MPLPKDYNARKALPLFTFLTEYFPDAFIEVVKVAVAGNVQHNPGEKLHWARGKSMDQLNTAMRHMMDHGTGSVYDQEPPEVLAAIGEDGTMHLAKAAWRLLAEIQLLCEARDARNVELFPDAYQLTPDPLQPEERVVGMHPALAAGYGAPVWLDVAKVVPVPALVPGRLQLACGCFGVCKGHPEAYHRANDQIAVGVVPTGTGPCDPAGVPYATMAARIHAQADGAVPVLVDPAD